MKKTNNFSRENNIDYFDLLDKSESIYKNSHNFKINFTKNNETFKKRRITENIIETEADKLRKKEIKATISELYQLRTTGESQDKALTDLYVKNRRAELINCKRVLNLEGDINKKFH